MRRFACLLFLCFALPCVGQSYPDVEALLDMAFTSDAGVFARHLPVELLKAVDQLSPAEQLAFEHSVMFSEQLKNEDVMFTRSEVLPTLIELRKKGHKDEEPATIVLDKRICDGYESLLRLRFNTGDKKDLFSDLTLLVWMRFEEGEWRLLEIGSGEGNDRTNLEDPAMVETFRARSTSTNETAAIASLRSYNAALATYSSSFPSTGFPSRLECLGCTYPEARGTENACLIDPALATNPYEKAGYRFSYRPLLQSGPTRYYTLIARPAGYGASGKRSFFTDESGVIRWTEEDREPTVAEPRLP